MADKRHTFGRQAVCLFHDVPQSKPTPCHLHVVQAFSPSHPMHSMHATASPACCFAGIPTTAPAAA
eukprot:360045-Chlamydomonas_euryale.AAC.14